jgi:hypothetical protein
LTSVFRDPLYSHSVAAGYAELPKLREVLPVETVEQITFPQAMALVLEADPKLAAQWDKIIARVSAT